MNTCWARGRPTLTLAYDRLGEAHSYELYKQEHAAGQFGDDALLSQSAYQAELDQIVWDAEDDLSDEMEGQDSVVFLAPLGAHNAIAFEAWQVVAQWDVVTVDGTTNVIRHGTYAGDPEHSQTLTNLKTRITTAAADDDFSDDRIANVSGLQAYYTTIGAYGDITPDDGDTTTFTPAQPPGVHVCLSGSAVATPVDNRPLVQDCGVLLGLKDTLAGAATLNWSTSTAMSSWDGVTTGGTPSRVTGLVLTSESLTGSVPPELARLTSLGELKLSGNTLTGCIPLALRQISDHDLDDLSLSYCGDPPPAPDNLGVTLTDSTFSLSWDEVTNADQYELQYRTGTESDWIAIDPTTADTSTTFALAGGLICGTFEFQFQVRARGDGITFVPDWSAWTTESDAISVSGSSPLASDCGTLLSVKDTLAGTGTLNWSVDTAIADWDGVTVSRVPTDSGLQSRVTELDVRFKNLTGTIPPELGSLDALQELLLNRNQLTGPIPPELGNLSNLTKLYANNNQLTGSIPEELGSLSELTQLGLSDNQLDGGIPTELGNLADLTTLWLHNNQLSGAIPVELAAPQRLATLNLSGNTFTGCIPVALRNIATNDLSDLTISYCGNPPAPEALSVSLADDAYSITWDEVAGAARYRVQYRTSSESDWLDVSDTDDTDTSATLSLAEDAVCDTAYEFQVQAYGDGKVYEADWGTATEASATCNQAPAFGEESYTFSIAEDAAINDAVGSVSATDADAADSVTYSISDGNTEGKFAIGSSTGTITVNKALDYETTPSYTLTVQATDNNGGTATASVTVTVTNVAEGLPPVPEGLSATLANGTFSIAWDAVSGADQYEVQYRTGPEAAWLDVTDTDTTDTSATPSAACSTRSLISCKEVSTCRNTRRYAGSSASMTTVSALWESASSSDMPTTAPVAAGKT